MFLGGHSYFNLIWVWFSHPNSYDSTNWTPFHLTSYHWGNHEIEGLELRFHWFRELLNGETCSPFSAFFNVKELPTVLSLNGSYSQRWDLNSDLLRPTLLVEQGLHTLSCEILKLGSTDILDISPSQILKHVSYFHSFLNTTPNGSIIIFVSCVSFVISCLKFICVWRLKSL